MDIFYNKFRFLNKEREVDSLGYSPSTAYLSECQNQKISPRTNGLVKYTKQYEADIIAKDNTMGPCYAKAIGNCL